MKKITGLMLLMILALSFCAFSTIRAEGMVKPVPTFALKAKYSYIRSCPKGGGIFIVSIEPEAEFSGKVFFSLVAPESLHAKLSNEILDRGSRITEITIKPGSNVPIGIHTIELAAFHVEALAVKDIQTIQLQVEVFEWESIENPNLDARRDLFVSWLQQQHQEFGIYLGQPYSYYVTYPEILIVEHGTYLNSEWEMRVCDHVMIPPYDWSMFCLRKRGALEPVFAARRESDNTIHEIPVSEYPVMFGY